MKFAVKAWSKGTRARAGSVQVGSCPSPIETPSLLLSTRKGLPHYIPLDMLSSLPSPDSHLFHISPLHFLEGLSPKTISTIGGLHKLVGLPEYGFAAVMRDSIQCLPEFNSTSKLGASFATPCGRLQINTIQYMEMIHSMRPNIWATLADEVPAWVSDKRNGISVDRTLKWADECIAQSSEGGVFGAIVGGSNVNERKRCAREIAKKKLSGYWIGGFGLGESMDERPVLLDTVTECLPEEKPRLISGLELPEEVLQGVAAGIDLFDSTYIYHLTLGGFALTFPLDRTDLSYSMSRRLESEQTKINLRATVYRKDTSPIVASCKCYTCQNHTKAYINHLLNVHEMLAQILLEIHNTHHYLGFFRIIREAIKEGKFEQFHQNFVQDRREYLAEAAAVCVQVAYLDHIQF